MFFCVFGCTGWCVCVFTCIGCSVCVFLCVLVVLCVCFLLRVTEYRVHEWAMGGICARIGERRPVCRLRGGWCEVVCFFMCLCLNSYV